MSRETHAPFCEGLGVKFPRSTLPNFGLITIRSPELTHCPQFWYVTIAKVQWGLNMSDDELFQKWISLARDDLKMAEIS